MVFKQYYLGCLAHASYLVGDEKSGRAAVVDPQRDVAQYLEDARAQHVDIRYAILTHFHADFVAGHLELKEIAGTCIGLGARATADYDFLPLKEGDAIDLGAVRLTILETPGHTPEGISILVYDLDRNRDAPHAVLTGDTLFLGDVGRPDLMASAGMSATELAGVLFESLYNKLLKLPDETLVYPAHGAGSMCGKNLSKDTCSTIGAQRRSNYALQNLTKEEFIRLVTADQPDAPQYFAYDADLNRRQRPTLREALQRELHPVSLQELLRLAGEGAQIVDVRDAAEFEAGHLTASVNVGLRGSFATWCGTVLDRHRPIVIIAQPGREAEAAMRLGRIGFDQVDGYLDGGMRALETRPDLIRESERITAVELAAELASPLQRPIVLDVRTVREHEERRIEGSVNMPLNHLAERTAELPRDRRMVIHCAGGYRSAIAASMLEAAGFAQIADLAGGMAAWDAAKLPAVAAPAIHAS